MKRTLWALVAGIFAVGAMVGCGNLKKDEFLPEYEAYKAENEDRFSALSSADAKTASDISALQNADKTLQTAVEDAKNDAVAASEQGDADTLEAAMKADKTLRMELDEAIAAGKKAATASAKRADRAMKKEVDAELAKSAKIGHGAAGRDEGKIRLQHEGVPSGNRGNAPQSHSDKGLHRLFQLRLHTPFCKGEKHAGQSRHGGQKNGRTRPLSSLGMPTRRRF